MLIFVFIMGGGRSGVDWPAGSAKREVAKKNSRLRTKMRRKSLAERKNGKLQKKFAVGVWRVATATPRVKEARKRSRSFLISILRSTSG